MEKSGKSESDALVKLIVARVVREPGLGLLIHLKSTKKLENLIESTQTKAKTGQVERENGFTTSKRKVDVIEGCAQSALRRRR